MKTASETLRFAVATLLARPLSPARKRGQVANSLSEYILSVPSAATLATLASSRDSIAAKRRHVGDRRAYTIPEKWSSQPSPERLGIGSTLSRHCGTPDQER